MLLERSKPRSSDGSGPQPGKVAIGEEQLDYVQRVLKANPHVRWTIVLMHKPAWETDNAAFKKIEEALSNRPYTVIAGHEHYYSYTQRSGRDYLDLGTTGGVWLNRGPGNMDHITWVTMTDEGPVFANIRLDGITDKNGPQ
jgi:6-phosphogluconate dehydrogenase (decarboxylating)